VNIEFTGGERLWMLLSFFVAMPGVSFCYYKAKKVEKEEHHHPRAEFVPYSHLRIRTKVVFVNKYQFVVFL